MIYFYLKIKSDIRKKPKTKRERDLELFKLGKMFVL